MQLIKMEERKGLKKYFINEKISQEEREKVWLVADGHDIMWVSVTDRASVIRLQNLQKDFRNSLLQRRNYGRDK